MARVSTGLQETRKAPRVRLACRLFFSTADHLEGEATVIDLSKTGCSAESDTVVETGMMLDLSIFLPDYEWRLHIDHAVVQWVRGQVFGVKFQALRPVQQERLRQLVEKFRAQSPRR